MSKNRCENCIHMEICRSLIDKFKHMNCHQECNCENFEDRDQYHKLPCSIGSTVYEVTSRGDIWERYVSGYHYNSIGKQKGAWLLVGTICGMMSRIRIDRIGQNVFLTRDEAEVAAANINLKEHSIQIKN